ncbi:ATPase, partial [Actinoplanes sp. NPDC051633]
MTVTGNLGLADVAAVRLTLMKCLAEQPESVFIDLDAMRVEQPLALAVFMAVARQAARWPGIPVLLCTDMLETRTHLQSAPYHRLPLFPDIDSARRHSGMPVRSLPRISDEILPIQGAGRHARNVATDACLRWDLPDLIGP